MHSYGVSHMTLSPLIMKKYLSVITVLSILAGSFLPSAAVTKDEMNEAQAIAAKFYVRYANNGAGYLDNWLPKSMTELEQKLTNNTDRENLKKFRSMSVPSDYASWDKDKLTEYWSNTFFAENGKNLNPEAAGNGLCKKQIRAAVSAMSVAAPQTPEPPAATEPAPEVQAEPETPMPEQDLDSEFQTVEGEIAEADRLEAEEELVPLDEKKENSGTWVYIMILAILVAVVIFLVIYASRTMKGGNAVQVAKQTREPEVSKDTETGTTSADEGTLPYEKDFHPKHRDTADLRLGLVPPTVAASFDQKQRDTEEGVVSKKVTVVEETRVREKYAATLASKTEEIRSLNRQLSELESINASLKDENRRLTSEIEALRNAAADIPAADNIGADLQRRNRMAPSKEVFLGRVNARGIFVRADRHAVEGQSIYKLSTSDGHTGKFSLISNPIVEEQVLEDPEKWLAGGCSARDLLDTDGRERIVTDSPGTAVFSDGAWRVEQKARIRYI